MMEMIIALKMALLIIIARQGKGSGHGSQHGPTGLIVGPNAWLQRKVALHPHYLHLHGYHHHHYHYLHHDCHLYHNYNWT